MNGSVIRLRFPVVFYALALLGGLTSCIKEDFTPCIPEVDVTGVKLHYYYTLNPYTTEEQEVNLFGSEVHEMNIYVFDGNGFFLKDTLINNSEDLGNDNEIFIPLSPGKYTLVSWGGDVAGMNIYDTYDVVDVPDPSDPGSFLYYLTPGVTMLKDFRLMLKNDGSEDSDHITSLRAPKTLYYANYQEVEVVSKIIETRNAEVIKNTNLFHVKIGGIMNLPSVASRQSNMRNIDEIPIDVFISSKNGRYKYNNQIGEYARFVKYEQPYTMPAVDTLKIDFTMLRLMMGDRESKLIIESSDLPSGQLTLDIVSAIFSADDRINQQDDFDKYDSYTIEVNLNKNLSATVFINGWHYNVIYPGLYTSEYEK